MMYQMMTTKSSRPNDTKHHSAKSRYVISPLGVCDLAGLRAWEREGAWRGRGERSELRENGAPPACLALIVQAPAGLCRGSDRMCLVAWRPLSLKSTMAWPRPIADPRRSAFFFAQVPLSSRGHWVDHDRGAPPFFTGEVTFNILESMSELTLDAAFAALGEPPVASQRTSARCSSCTRRARRAARDVRAARASHATRAARALPTLWFCSCARLLCCARFQAVRPRRPRRPRCSRSCSHRSCCPCCTRRPRCPRCAARAGRVCSTSCGAPRRSAPRAEAALGSALGAAVRAAWRAACGARRRACAP